MIHTISRPGQIDTTRRFKMILVSWSIVAVNPLAICPGEGLRVIHVTMNSNMRLQVHRHSCWQLSIRSRRRHVWQCCVWRSAAEYFIWQASKFFELFYRRTPLQISLSRSLISPCRLKVKWAIVFMGKCVCMLSVMVQVDVAARCPFYRLNQNICKLFAEMRVAGTCMCCLRALDSNF